MKSWPRQSPGVDPGLDRHVVFHGFRKFENLAGVAMALASGMTYAFYMVLLEKQGLSRLNPFLCSFWLALFAAGDLFVVGSFTDALCFQRPLISYLTMIVIAMMTLVF